MREVRAVSQRMPDYDALLARENQAQERIQKALYELDMQRTRDAYSPSTIRHILEGKP